MDFLADLLIGIERELAADGITVPAALKSDGVVFLATYGEYLMRKIEPAKRTVHYSASLTASPRFSEFTTSLANLKDLSEKGGNLSPYQSKNIDHFQYSESLLFDWGIQHLHLGELREGERFSDRSGPLLFAMFRPGDAYFIAILEHGGWAEIDLLNIIDSEWPHLLDPFTLRGVIDIQTVPTPQDTLMLRKAGVTVLQKLTSGKIIASPGGGITTARSSTAAMMDAQRAARIVHQAEDAVRKNEAVILKALSASSLDEVRLADVPPNNWAI